MRLVDNLSGIESYYLIISGNGTFPERIVFKNLCKKFNGYEKAIFFIGTPLKKQTGLDALNAIPLYPKKYNIYSIIFLVDGEHIKEDSIIEIRNHLESIGISINEVIPLQGAFCIKCKSGPHRLILYCIILGPEVFIEEEVAKLIKVKLGIEIDLSRKRNSSGRKMVKGKIKQILRERGTSVEKLVRNIEKDELENIFPNICAVLKRIEKEQ